MTPHPSLSWNEILAAYADGELEGRDDLAPLKQRVEVWLAEHPEAAAELARIRQLKQAWQETTPPGPAPHVWRRLLQAIERTPRQAPIAPASWRRKATVAAVLAASIAFVFAMWSARRPGVERLPEAASPVEAAPFSVAAAHEVEILNVDGADTPTLVVGELPVQGPLVLAAPGEVTVTSVQPAARDNMVPEVNVQGPRRPMIWARAETD